MQKLTTGGKRHKRYLQCSTQLDKIYWKYVIIIIIIIVIYRTAMDAKVDAGKCVHASDITDIKSGQCTKGFTDIKPKIDADRCFSIITKDRDYDFEAASASAATEAVKALRGIFENSRPI